VRILTESSQPGRDAAFYGKMLSFSSCVDCSCTSPVPFLKKIMSAVSKTLELGNQTSEVASLIQCIGDWIEKYKDGKPLLERVCRLPSVKEAGAFGIEDRDYDKEDCYSRIQMVNCVPTDARDLETTCLLAGFKDASLQKILAARFNKTGSGTTGKPLTAFLEALRAEVRLESVRFVSFELEKSMGSVGYYKNFFSLSKRLTSREFPNNDFAGLVAAFGSNDPKEAVILYLQKAGVTDSSALDSVSEIILEKENEADVVPFCPISNSTIGFIWKDIDATLISFLDGSCDGMTAKTILRVVNGHTLAKCLSCLDVEWLAGFDMEDLETMIKNEAVDFYPDEFANLPFWKFVIRHISELKNH
jgi:hypothetical protein